MLDEFSDKHRVRIVQGREFIKVRFIALSTKDEKSPCISSGNSTKQRRFMTLGITTRQNTSRIISPNNRYHKHLSKNIRGGGITLLLLDIAVKIRDHSMDFISPEETSFKFRDDEEKNIFALTLILKLFGDKAHEAGDEFGGGLEFIGVIGGRGREGGDELVFELSGIEEGVCGDEEGVFIVWSIREDERTGRRS